MKKVSLQMIADSLGVSKCTVSLVLSGKSRDKRVSEELSRKIIAKAKELKAQGLDVCSMCAGEPDFDTPRAIKDACIDALNAGKVTYTPASGLVELRKLVAEKFVRDNGIKATWEQTVVAPGAKFSVFSALAALPANPLPISMSCRMTSCSRFFMAAMMPEVLEKCRL